MVIRILDHAKSVSTYSDGDIIFRLIAEEMSQGREVYVSFDGIKSVPSAFVNAALIRLIERFPFEEIRSRLHIVNSTRQINRLVKDRFAFATGDRKLAG
jgi:uncharacterized protein DUF4325